MEEGRNHWPQRLLALAAALLLLLSAPSTASALSQPAAAESAPAGPTPAGSAQAVGRYLCGGDPLEAERYQGAVDTPVPNTQAGTVPGSFLVLRWRERTLQLPRTNIAGAPSYTDGLWWWSEEDPEHPRFLRGRGQVEEFACAPL
ncbi:MAG: hypothetical protein ACOVNL_07980 [Prochlorococcaceae cyanobacterium]|jgi:hypothetical protein